MGFDPDAYGNPAAKKSASRGYNPQEWPDVDPGWGPLVNRTPSVQASSNSVRSERNLQSVRNDETTPRTHPQEASATPVNSARIQNGATSLDVETGSARTFGTGPQSSAPATTASLPQFDARAYGHPAKSSDTKASDDHPREHLTAAAIEAKETPMADPTQLHRHTSTPGRQSSESAHAAAPSPTPTPRIAHQTPGSQSFQNQTPQSRTASNRVASESQKGPATYQNIRHGNETPEQLIARLQADSQREIFNRVKRKDDGDSGATTALEQLDVLRKTVPQGPGSVASQTLHQPQACSANEQNLNGNNDQHVDLNTHPALEQTTTQAHDAVKNKWAPAPLQPDADRLSREKANDANLTAVQPIGETSILTASVDPIAKPATYTLNDSAWAPKPRVDNRGPRASRWATRDEIKATPVKPDSNAEGSVLSESDADSTAPMAKGFGRLIRTHKPPVSEEKLVSWDGKFMPPPVDWEHRPQFYNNKPEYISGFENWLADVAIFTMSDKSAPEVEFGILPTEKVADVDNHADGIGFTTKDTVLHPSNAERYGHRLVHPIEPELEDQVDFEGKAKLDLEDADNNRYKDETAELYINRHMQRIQQVQQEATTKTKVQKSKEEEKMDADKLAVDMGYTDAAEMEAVLAKAALPITTKNIYLRPAVEADAAGMKEILNWHIANSVRPVELKEVTEEDILERLTMSQDARLPVIVAIERTRKTSGVRTRKNRGVRRDHPIQNIDPEYIGVTRGEPIVGWSSATDWSASHYVEAITAELELYVAPGHRKSGVGRCLMDAMLHATDRGHMPRQGYEFRVAPEVRHLYSCGGGRTLHKLIFQVRCYNKPVSPEQQDRIEHMCRNIPQHGPVNPKMRARMGYRHDHDTTPEVPFTPKKDYSKAARMDDREDDYEIWLKDWFKDNKFEEEACIKKIGTKHGRYVDMRYLCRETAWSPAEREVPNFTNGY